MYNNVASLRKHEESGQHKVALERYIKDVKKASEERDKIRILAGTAPRVSKPTTLKDSYYNKSSERAATTLKMNHTRLADPNTTHKPSVIGAISPFTINESVALESEKDTKAHQESRASEKSTTNVHSVADGCKESPTDPVTDDDIGTNELIIKKKKF